MLEEKYYQHNIICLNKDKTRNKDLDVIVSLSDTPPTYIKWNENTKYQYAKTTSENIHQYDQV